jgi:hypothetical protein
MPRVGYDGSIRESGFPVNQGILQKVLRRFLAGGNGNADMIDLRILKTYIFDSLETSRVSNHYNPIPLPQMRMFVEVTKYGIPSCLFDRNSF